MRVTNRGIVIIMTNPEKNSLSNKEVVYVRNKLNKTNKMMLILGL